MMMKIRAAIGTVVVATSVMMTSPAKAEIITIATASNNIHCDVGDDPEVTALVCTIFERFGPMARPKPADCERSWGHTYFISQKGQVQMLCLDAWTSDWPGNAKFQSNETSDFQGVICEATDDSLECRNLDGHGFVLSRKVQKVF